MKKPVGAAANNSRDIYPGRTITVTEYCLIPKDAEQIAFLLPGQAEYDIEPVFFLYEENKSSFYDPKADGVTEGALKQGDTAKWDNRSITFCS